MIAVQFMIQSNSDDSSQFSVFDQITNFYTFT